MLIGHAHPKVCLNPECSREYLPTGRCQKYCAECGRRIALAKNRQRSKQFHAGGPGKGGNQWGEDNHQWTGQNWSQKTRRRVIERAGFRCEQCGEDLSGVIGKSFHGKNGWWVIDHKDGNRRHNGTDNLWLLCKRCHQMKHECWKNFSVKG